MKKLTSKLFYFISRIVKGIIACALIPPLIGLIASIRQDLGSVYASSRSLSEWVDIGAISYIGIHLLLYKPMAMFKFQHQALSKIASWLFGSQVSTSGAKEDSKGKEKGKRKSDKASPDSTQGSTLLVLSPYLVPFYSMFFCLATWMLLKLSDSGWIHALMISLIGASLTMHWVMTADDLQKMRERFTIEAYIISLCIIGLISSLVVCACLPLAVYDYSVTATLSKAIVASKDIYVYVFRGVFL